MKRFSFLITVLFCSLTYTFLACSARIAPINVDPEGVALKGYDPVAYFTLAGPVKGRKELQYGWHGANWLFSSQEHLDMFQENPEKYAPQYGGY